MVVASGATRWLKERKLGALEAKEEAVDVDSLFRSVICKVLITNSLTNSC